MDAAARRAVEFRLRATSVLRASGVALRPDAAPIDFSCGPGEIVGVAGLEGHGQDVFLRRAARCRHGRRARSSAIDGGSERMRSARRAPRREPGSPTCRVSAGPRRCSTTLSIRENFAVPTIGATTSGLVLIGRRRTERRLRDYVDRLRIRLGRHRATRSRR